MPWHPCTFARVAAADWHLRLTPSSLGAAWTKWVDDLLFTQSMLQSLPDGPAGNMPGVAPCVFGNCRNNPRPASGGGPGAGHKLQAVLETDVAWGSVLPLLGVYTARLTDDARLASRSAVGAAAYVGLLHSFANSPTSDFPGLLNATSSGSVGWAGRLGDWCPAVQAPGQRQVSTLLNSHHLILDTDAAVSLLEWHDEDSLSASGPGDRPRDAYADAGPSASELAQWAATARSSFAKAFLHNITFPVTGPVVCGSAPEKIPPLELTCGGGANDRAGGVCRVRPSQWHMHGGLPPKHGMLPGREPAGRGGMPRETHVLDRVRSRLPPKAGLCWNQRPGSVRRHRENAVGLGGVLHGVARTASLDRSNLWAGLSRPLPSGVVSTPGADRSGLRDGGDGPGTGLGRR